MGSGDPRVTVELRDRVAYVTINRPETKNALCKSMYAAIRDAAVATDVNPDADLMVIQGSNGAFASGGDLKEILDVLENDPPAILDYEEYLPFEAVRTMKKPTIAVIDGLCIGGGLSLALMCDLLIATDRSRFAIPEAKVGIVDGHLPRFLRDIVPQATLRYWMYTGVLFPAAEAQAAGLLTKLVTPEELPAALDKLIAGVKTGSPVALQMLKHIFNEKRQLSAMTDAYLMMLQPEVLKRLQAFRDK